MIIINKLKHDFRFVPKYVHSGIIIATFTKKFDKEYVSFESLDEKGAGQFIHRLFVINDNNQ